MIYYAPAVLTDWLTTAMHYLTEAFGGYLRTRLHRQPATVKQYTTVINQFVSFLSVPSTADPTALSTVTKLQLTDYLSQYAVTKPVFNQHLAALRALFDYLLDAEVILDNPARRIHRLRFKPKKRIPLSMDEFLSLLRAVEQGQGHYRARNRALVLLGFLCPLRVTELVSLNLSHIDWQGRLLDDVLCKGGVSQSLPFPPIVGEALEIYLTQRSAFGVLPEEPALFVSDRGTRLSVRQTEELVSSYARRAGINRPVSPHLLRHSSATAQAQRGLSLWGLQQLLNHESIMATQRYVHLLSDLRPAIEALGAEVAERWQQEHSSVFPTSSTFDHAPISRGSPPFRGRSGTARLSNGRESASE